MDKQRILVVDDHEPLLTAIQGILEEEGYAVFTATDGTEALNMMEEVYPSLIIADIMMPRMDGVEFIRYARNNDRYNRIKIMVMTGLHENDPRVDVVKEVGVEDILYKPCDDHDLVLAIREAMSN